MRTGAFTLQQALTAEASTVLKLSQALARRRGHAQVTPLHVATTLFSASNTSSSLLRLACLKSQPRHPASHPLQCRALDLCFNVALNRLPTSPSSALLNPSLSNALIAALKRAQAHQRRGCVELQHQQLSPLLAIKVELEQLIISILDDPSVSRVMREAGFSSTCVKNNLEEETSANGSSLAHKDIINPFSKLSSRHTPPRLPPPPSQTEDLSAVMEVMLRKQGRRNNAVVVGDSVAIADGIVADLMAKVEKGDVPSEIKNAHFVKLHLSPIHLPFMSRSDVDSKVSDLRKKIVASEAEREGRGVIIHAGDLRWAVDEEARDGCEFKPVDHMVEELGRLLSQLPGSNGCVNGKCGKVWLLATASYQTYVRCQMRQPSLEALWGLEAVVVPSGGLALSLQLATSGGLESRLAKLFEHPLLLLGSKNNSSKDEEKLSCCSECTSNFEKEASLFKSEKNELDFGATQLPCWLQKHRPDNQHKDSLLKLRRIWNNLCQSLHHTRQNSSNLCSSYSWRSDSNRSSETSTKLDGTRFPFNAANPIFEIGDWLGRDEAKPRGSQISLNSLRNPRNEDANVTLSLVHGALPSNSAASSKDKDVLVNQEDLSLKLQENIPWQSEIIPSIVELLTDTAPCENKGLCILLEGGDHISKRRLARVMSEHFGGSKVHINMRKWANKASLYRETLEEAMEKDSKVVILVEAIDRADSGFTRYLIDVSKAGSKAIVIMTTSNTGDEDSSNNVIKMKLQVEGIKPMDKDHKRKPDTTLQNTPKRTSFDLDLNLLPEEEGRKLDDDEEAAPSDLTDETGYVTPNVPPELLQLVHVRFTLEERSKLASKRIVLKLQRAFAEAVGEGIGRLVVDESAEEELTAAAGFFSEWCFERWARSVLLEACSETFKNGGGGNVRLRAEGKLGNVEEFGFLGSVLPRKLPQTSLVVGPAMRRGKVNRTPVTRIPT